MAEKFVDEPQGHTLSTSSTLAGQRLEHADSVSWRCNGDQEATRRTCRFCAGTMCPRFRGRRLCLDMRPERTQHHATRRREQVVEVFAVTLLDMLIHGKVSTNALTASQQHEARKSHPALASSRP